jgi:hypothetical protein
MVRTVLSCTLVVALVVVGCGKKDRDKGRATPADQTQPVTSRPTEKPIEPESDSAAATPSAPAAPAPAPLGPCPAATTIAEVTSSIDITDSGPFDWSKFTIAKALSKDDGKQLRIFISDQDYPIKKMDGLMTPVAAKGDAVLAISLYNGDQPVTIGEYSPGKYKEPHTALAELQVHRGDRGAFVGLGITGGVVRVLDMPDGKVCGEFEVKSEKSLAKGTFVAPIE